MRERWGCDAPAPAPVFEVTCARCGGMDPGCELCSGRNAVPVYRCPQSHSSVDLSMAFQAYHLVQHGILPAAGGWNDQCASFAAFVSVVNAEREAIQKDEERRREMLTRLKAGARG